MTTGRASGSKLGLDLDGVRLKIERARHHITDFERQASAFLARHPYSFIVEATENGHFIARHVVPADPVVPANWSAVIGDALHNLRSSLDHLACAVARWAHMADPEKASFPFTPNAREWRTAVKKSGMDKAGLESAVRQANSSLRELHELDIVDKHRALVLAYVLPPSKSPSFETPFGPVQIEWTGGVSGVWSPAFKGGYSVGDAISMSAEIVFRDPPCRGKVVLDTLRDQAVLVEQTVQAFEMRCG